MYTYKLMSPLTIPPFETSNILSQQFSPAKKKTQIITNFDTHREVV